MDQAPLYIDYCIDKILDRKIPENSDLKHSILTEEVYPVLAPLKETLTATERV